jgi:dTDP-4-dehydrorhamnose 3,5-epimerase
MLTSIKESILTENLIYGVEFKELKTFPDDRGFFRELIRESDDFFADGFAQWSHSKMGKDTVKAWHFHHLQVDWWYVPIGVLHTVLYDNREESPSFKRKMEFKLGETDLDPDVLTTVVKIPQGVIHGCRVITDYSHLFYITSKTYNPDDEGRYPFNSPIVPHTWGDESSIIVAPNDKRTFLPKSNRLILE